MDVGADVDDDAAGDSDTADTVGGRPKTGAADADVSTAVRANVDAVVDADSGTDDEDEADVT